MASANTKHYLDPGVLATIDRLEFRARHVVEGFLTGMHRSPYNGFSVEFASHREYVPGDDIKHIDWKVWARSDRINIKQYEEETNLRFCLVLDCSRSMAYRTQAEQPDLDKFDLAATLTASLAYFIQKKHDAPGLVLFDDAIRAQLPPSTSRTGIERMLHLLETTSPSQATDVRQSMHALAAQIPRRSIVALVSDLFLPSDDLLRSLRDLRQRKCEVIVLHVLHREEVEFPFVRQTLFRSMEGGTEIMADGRAIRKRYLEELGRFLEKTREVCARCGADYVPIHGTQQLAAGLSSYLAARARHASGRRA